jgi:hypothetical protein
MELYKKWKNRVDSKAYLAPFIFFSKDLFVKEVIDMVVKLTSLIIDFSKFVSR